MFSGLFWSSFVSVFLEIVGHRRMLSESWWIRYSTFSAFQTAPLYLSPPFSEFSGWKLAFSISWKHWFFQKEAEVRQLTSYEKSSKIALTPQRRIKTIFNHFWTKHAWRWINIRCHPRKSCRIPANVLSECFFRYDFNYFFGCRSVPIGRNVWKVFLIVVDTRRWFQKC